MFAISAQRTRPTNDDIVRQFLLGNRVKSSRNNLSIAETDSSTILYSYSDPIACRDTKTGAVTLISPTTRSTTTSRHVGLLKKYSKMGCLVGH